MELTGEQRQAVKGWLAAGASLSDVQKNLKSEFGLTMTFMDVRLLVLEIGAEVKDKPEPKPLKPEPQPEADEEGDEPDPYAEEFGEEAESAAEGGIPPEAQHPEDAAGSKVTLSLDRLVVPGAMVSGNVTFSDGVRARWLIDQYGRFGLEPEKPGYRPSNEDLQDFQVQLRLELRRHGYA